MNFHSILSRKLYSFYNNHWDFQVLCFLPNETFFGVCFSAIVAACLQAVLLAEKCIFHLFVRFLFALILISDLPISVCIDPHFRFALIGSSCSQKPRRALGGRIQTAEISVQAFSPLFLSLPPPPPQESLLAG